MADGDSSHPGGVDRPTSFPLLAGGVLLAIVVVIVAFAVDSTIGWPVLILVAICLVAALGFRVITSRASSSDADSSSNVPHQPSGGDRPLGDTEEAHDEINPHDIPKDAPERDRTEEVAGTDGTTRGPVA